MSVEALCPAPATWRITAMALEQDRIVWSREPRRNVASCPVCATPSRRVHRRYRRNPWEVPWGLWPVPRLVQARRFFCDAPTCPRRIVVEPFPRVLARYARQTARLRHVLLELAHASHAEMAARRARWLGSVTSPDTRMRCQRAAPINPPSPRVWGVDAFALRRGCTSGTLLVDLERRPPVAVLEGRTAEPLRKWLQDHPTVAILVRDRAHADALAGRLAAPDALQVADRVHRLRHVSEALKALLPSRRWHPPATDPQPELSPHASTTLTVSPTDTPPKAMQPTPRTRAVWEAVQQRRGLGQSLRQLAPA